MMMHFFLSVEPHFCLSASLSKDIYHDSQLYIHPLCPKRRGRTIKHDQQSVFLKFALYFRNQVDCDTKLVFPFGNRS